MSTWFSGCARWSTSFEEKKISGPGIPAAFACGSGVLLGSATGGIAVHAASVLAGSAASRAGSGRPAAKSDRSSRPGEKAALPSSAAWTRSDAAKASPRRAAGVAPQGTVLVNLLVPELADPREQHGARCERARGPVADHRGGRVARAAGRRARANPDRAAGDVAADAPPAARPAAG